MNIVEEQAEDFVDDWFNAGDHNKLEDLKSRLDDKLYSFSRDRDKLDFLKMLRNHTKNKKIEHEKTCKTVKCDISKAYEVGFFVIDQEVDSINEYYTYEPEKDEEFSAEEESKLHSKLNDIIDRLEKQGYGQEILFQEIEDLKNHFQLGKRNWFQLLKGKLFDLGVEKTLEHDKIKELFQEISSQFEDYSKMIN